MNETVFHLKSVKEKVQENEIAKKHNIISVVLFQEYEYQNLQNINMSTFAKSFTYFLVYFNVRSS